MIRYFLRLYRQSGLELAPRDSGFAKLHGFLRSIYRRFKTAEKPLDALKPMTAGDQIISGMLAKEPELLAAYDPKSWWWVRAIDGEHYRFIRSADGDAFRLFDYHFRYQEEHIWFGIDNAVRLGKIKGIALIFFMGMGDYFFTTPLLRDLRHKYPQLQIAAYVSNHADHNNAPFVAELLAANPDIDSVQMYEGKSTGYFKNYDYRAVLKAIPDGFLPLPMLYEHLERTPHRVTSLYHTFLMKAPEAPPAPLLHLPETTPAYVAALAEKVVTAAQTAKGIVFLQTDSRSSGFSYPFADELGQLLLDDGYVIVSASTLSMSSPKIFAIDFAQFSLVDSIQLLDQLRQKDYALSILSVTSVFWSLSAALGLPNLGMIHTDEVPLHAVWYPNIWTIQHKDRPAFPAERVFHADAADYELTPAGHAAYRPAYVMQCFAKMQAALAVTRRP